MRGVRAWLVRLAATLTPWRRDREITEELNGHLELAIEENLRDGMSPEQARRVARLELGGADQVKSAMRDVRTGARLERLWRDAGLATRRLIRAPTLVVALVGTLMMGLGLFAVVYTVVQKILIEPMPYRDPGDLYFVWRDYGPIFDLKRGWLAGTDVVELQKAGGVIESAVGLDRQLGTLTLRDGRDPTEIEVMVTSPSLFGLLGAHPVLGRGFAPGEVGPGHPSLIVLTHELWNRLGGDPAIVGTQVRLNGQPYTVIGVMPPTFAFVRNASLGPPQHVDAYTTFDINLADTSPGGGYLSALIRARHGSSPEAVAASVAAVGRVVDARDFKGRGLKLYSVGLKADLVSPARPALLVLGFAGIFLLLVLMVNLASVLLARAAQRGHEFAVSRALGASGVALVRVTLFEGGLLGFVGGVTGAGAAIWGTRMLVALAPLDLPRLEAVAVDWRIGAIITITGVLLGLLAATVAATWTARTSLSSLLSASAVRGGGGHSAMGRGIVVVQVALSLVLLSTGGLVVRSFERLLISDPGFRAKGVLTLRVPMPAQLFPNTTDALAVQDRIQTALETIPRVTSVSAADALPLTANPNSTTIAIPGAPGNSGDTARDAPLVDYFGARAAYFDVMGMRIIGGRTFEKVRHDGVREAVVDGLFARHFFPTGTALGAQIPFRDGALTVVGIVDQARMYNLHQDGRPQLFVRAEDWDYRSLSFVLRTEREPDGLIPDVRSAIRRVDPRLALGDIRTMDEIVDNALRQQRLSAVLIASFALGALLLAAMGLFGAVSGSITRRRFELAVRLAVGADSHQLLRFVVGEGARLVGFGVLIGIPAVYITGSLIRGVLVGVSPSDPLTLVTVALGLGIVGIAACYLPARRVLDIEPAESLRQE